MKDAHYKQLAYERATLLNVVRLARERYLPLEGMDNPEVRIESDDLPRSDCVVPEDAIIDVIVKLDKLADKIEKEMRQYSFTRVENNYEKEWEERPSQSSPAKPGAPPTKGKGKGGKGSPQAPAAK